jgi:type II secretory pathway predicted ATPase ExeA
VWKRHWKLLRDPFLGAGAPYVSVAPHDEAVARLVDTIETGQRRAVVRAGAGLGKSLVLARALAETRGPWRRAVLLSSPIDGPGLLAGLAEALGRRVAAGASRGLSWKALDEAVRLCRWQRQRVVLAIDDCQRLTEPADRLDLERLAHLDPHPETRLTILQAFRTDEDEGPATRADPWELSIRLPALTRTDAEVYLVSKLAAAGRDEPTFTPRAVQRLHLVSAGNPRGLDRLASLALMAGALRGLEIVTPEVIEGIARECTSNPAVSAP